MLTEVNDGEFVESHRVLRPFGPRIYRGKLSADNLKFIQDFAELARKGQNIGDSLSGNIKDQNNSDIGDKALENKIVDILIPHLQEWYKIEDTDRIHYMDEDDPELEKIKCVDYNTIRFHTGTGTWFNYMKANEFNPLHAHTGDLSGILMVKVPKEIAKEREVFEIKSNARSPGMLEWVHGEYGAGAYRIYPVEGELYLFDAQLRHQVYPFQSDVERITMSWNIFDVSFDTKMEINFG